ncbi:MULTISPECIES: MarR family winged helix-turn-helix transcriptional regulator [Enterococcus]|uniref:HTH marR-type domain-containing protein n=1 Tax=Candidatus Enterococcus ferrettii TaxID=2815324 RepID=A0ABV0ETL7_9ENTE|nr:MarR family transcriptional regulator [Enterococcus sp. 665A]MBO1339848.1 MarR family transcriptional regulator [Enterococcus sp. 665A]
MKIEECINFLLSVSQHKVFKHYSQLLEEQGVTPAQAGILSCLWNKGQLTPKKIAEALHLEAPTISGILDKMQKLELIEREVDPNNRRVVLVSTTKKADNMQSAIESVTQRLNDDVLSAFSDEESQLLKKLLEKLISVELTSS